MTEMVDSQKFGGNVLLHYKLQEGVRQTQLVLALHGALCFNYNIAKRRFSSPRLVGKCPEVALGNSGRPFDLGGSLNIHLLLFVCNHFEFSTHCLWTL